MTYEEYCVKRDALGLTDYAVAKLGYVSRATLSQWKNGNSSPSEAVRNKINYLLTHYDPNEYYTAPPFITGKGYTSPHVPDYVPPAVKQPLMRIDSFTVIINEGIPVELSENDFKELRKATEAFALSWLKLNGKIKG